ncbi:MAG: OsmC family protein [Candidatus Wallbacteria bacterium]|nr:OsmC family protein [Candidatus Wallbacteria bacterium]
MYQVELTYNNGFQWDIVTGSHFIASDLSPEEGGDNEGPNPEELFLAALGSGAGMEITRFIKKHNLEKFSEFKVTVSAQPKKSPASLSHIKVRVTFPDDFPLTAKPKLLKELEKNSINSTLLLSPEVTVEETSAD